MNRSPKIVLGTKAVLEFGALTHYDEIWLVDGRDFITECGALMAYGEIWRIESRNRTTALVIAAKEGADTEAACTLKAA
jgi:hypothetical protein